MLVLTASLVPTGCKQATPVTDASLTAAVQNKLSSDGALTSEPIQATVQSAVVTLNGTVSSDAARALASSDASQVPGVRTVVNNLSIQPPVTAGVAPPPVTAPSASLPLPETQSTPASNSRLSRREREQQERQERRDRAARGAATQDAGPNVPPPSSATSVPPAPAPPPAPVVRNITLQAGTILPVRLAQTLDSASAQTGQSFSGTIASDVTSSDGITVIRQGSNVSGQITAVQEAAHFKGNALLTIALTNVTRRGEPVAITTEGYTATGKGRGTNTAEKVGGGAAVGAILGGIFGGGKGAAIGAAAGGGTGAGVNAITRGQQVQIPAESLVRFRLSSPVTLRVVSDGGDNNGTTPDQGRHPLQ